MNDERFFNSETFKVIPYGFPHYDVALTILWHENEEFREKIALAPMPCYATFAIDDVGNEYDELRQECLFSVSDYIQQWKKGDWALGMPHSVSDISTYRIFKKYEKLIIKEKVENV